MACCALRRVPNTRFGAFFTLAKSAKANTAKRTRSAPRLSHHVRPTTIDLHFELDPTQKVFRGEARYSLRLDKRIRKLELHAADLRVSAVRLRLGADILKVRVEARPESETVVLHFDRLLPAEPVRLELSFHGRVRNDLRGLYRSVDDREPWLATQLCPTDARRFFPCFDEPGIKACYRIRVSTRRDQTVISNAPVQVEVDEEPGRKTVHFETTPPLSSYLIAVAVGPFETSPTLMSGSTAIRVHTLPGRQDLTAFAREAAASSLTRLEQWFDMDHPYPKLDLLALPDFAFGAMENAGAVFFRDSILLLDADEASSEDRKRTGEVIAHELSHMWFGNLVTMAWWNDLWLNESFATWMAYEIIDTWQPDWRIWLDFAHRRENALEVDALASSHPIAPRIRSAKDAHENFDAITYTKGASVLRMLAGYLGHEVFRDGIRLYIRRHREDAATASDLWSALSEVSGVPVEEIVSPWTLQTGYPLVSLQRCERHGRRVIELVQERFLALPPRKAKTNTGGARWTIPWVGRVGRDQTDETHEVRAPRHLFAKSRDQISSQGAERTWIYGNADEAGFFRVEHGQSESEDLLANLWSLSPLERIGFVGNQWALTRANRIPISNLLDLVAALGVEEDPDVLFAVESVLSRLGRRLAISRGPHVEERLRAWVAVCFGEQLDLLGFEADPDDDERRRMRRARIFSIVGHFARVDAVCQECVSRCAYHFSTGEALPTELGDEIIRIAASFGGESLHGMLCEATRDAKTPQARRRTLFALAEFDHPKMIRASLAASLDVTLAPTPDRATLLAALLARPATAPATWRHLQKNWTRLEKEMPPILLARLAGATADALPHTSAAEISDFFERHPLAAGSRVLRQISEQMAIAKRFERQAGSDLEAYLADS
jgi:puromycin-sensitive aminopeptidase